MIKKSAIKNIRRKNLEVKIYKMMLNLKKALI
jgi:hypothetical protein